MSLDSPVFGTDRDAAAPRSSTACTDCCGPVAEATSSMGSLSPPSSRAAELAGKASGTTVACALPTAAENTSVGAIGAMTGAPGSALGGCDSVEVAMSTGGGGGRAGGEDTAGVAEVRAGVVRVGAAAGVADDGGGRAAALAGGAAGGGDRGRAVVGAAEGAGGGEEDAPAARRAGGAAPDDTAVVERLEGAGGCVADGCSGVVGAGVVPEGGRVAAAAGVEAEEEAEDEDVAVAVVVGGGGGGGGGGRSSRKRLVRSMYLRGGWSGRANEREGPIAILFDNIFPATVRGAAPPSRHPCNIRGTLLLQSPAACVPRPYCADPRFTCLRHALACALSGRQGSIG